MKDLVVKHKGDVLRLKYLEWDTKFFGMNSYALDLKGTKIRGSKGKDLLKKKVLDAISESFVTAKIPVNASENLVDLLFDMGFKYIDTQVTLEYFKKTIGINAFESEKDIGDILIEKVKKIPVDAYKLGKCYSKSRFHLDSSISAEKADKIWVDYIRNFKLSSKRQLFAARLKNKTVGGIFVEQHKEGNKKISCLFSVSVLKEHRGKDLGKSLLLYALKWCLKNSDVVIVGTQSQNDGALSFYLKNGFTKIRDVKLILHKKSG